MNDRNPSNHTGEYHHGDENLCREMLVTLRKIIQAVSLHSRDLQRRYGLTGPQLVILNEIANSKTISVTELSRHISVSQATVTDILNRLEKKGLVTRTRSDVDKRRIVISITEPCVRILEMAPSPLQDAFSDRFAILEDWEQLMILSAFKRVVDLMSAGKIDAATILDTDPL